MDEADEFDKIMQSVAEGTYHPTSSSSAMETFPVSLYLSFSLFLSLFALILLLPSLPHVQCT